jgi:hypothetical protein
MARWSLFHTLSFRVGSFPYPLVLTRLARVALDKRSSLFGGLSVTKLKISIIILAPEVLVLGERNVESGG